MEQTTHKPTMPATNTTQPFSPTSFISSTNNYHIPNTTALPRPIFMTRLHLLHHDIATLSRHLSTHNLSHNLTQHNTHPITPAQIQKQCNNILTSAKQVLGKEVQCMDCEEVHPQKWLRGEAADLGVQIQHVKGKGKGEWVDQGVVGILGCFCENLGVLEEWYGEEGRVGGCRGEEVKVEVGLGVDGGVSMGEREGGEGEGEKKGNGDAGEGKDESEKKAKKKKINKKKALKGKKGEKGKKTEQG